MSCGNLHIRTTSTDATLSPNIITQLIVVNGLRVGLIPESTLKSLYYNVIIRNDNNQIISSSESIPYVGTNNYIYVTIPFNNIPQVGQVIHIQLISDSGCSCSTNYTILQYTLPNSNGDSTTVSINGKLEKYIKIKPTISTGGFVADKTYYYNCSSSTISDAECFIEFNKNKDLSKILDKLPNNNVQICPPTFEWKFNDIICITPLIQPPATECNVQCSTILKMSGSIYRVTYVQNNVSSFTWTVYNSVNTSLTSGIIIPIDGYGIFDANFGNLGEGIYKLTLSPNNCTVTPITGTKNFAVTATSEQTAQIYNEIPDLTISAETYWNHFNPDKIPDIILPFRLDNITNKYIPNKWLFFNSYQGLSKFGLNSSEQLTKIFKKGFTHIAVGSLPIYEPNLENFVDGDRIIGYSSTDSNDDSLLNFKNYIKNSFNFAESYKVTKTDDKYNLFANLIQYNGRLTSTNSQDLTNYLVTGHYSAIENTNGRFGYSNLSYANTGGYITSDTYSQGNLLAFINYSDNTVELNYKNKTLKDSPKLLVGSIQTYYYETLLPQNYQVKDQNDTNWFTINHFGGEATNLVGVGQTPNSEHWASQIAGNVQNLYSRAKVFGQDVIITVKPTCDRGDTYLHSEPLSIFHNGKYIKEWGRYSNTLLNILTNQSYVSNFETESISKFVAEGQIILSYFAGARGINFNSNYLTKDLIPRIKTSNLKQGTQYNNLTSGNQDYEPYNYTMKAMWRLSQKISVTPTTTYSFFDICDGNEIYLNNETEVSYDGGINFIKQRALDWQINQKSPILAIVNLEKNIISICALQAYGVEQNSAIVRYNKNGKNFQHSISIPTNKVSIYMFDLGQTT